MFPTSPMYAEGSVSMSMNDSGSQDDSQVFYFQQQSPVNGGNNASNSESNSPNNTSANARRNVIDYSKFKTKMCRHFLMGLQCPFEDRCAFAHGNEQVRAQPMPPPPPSYASFVMTSVPESPVDSRPDTPPAYPTRFRYEPYSSNGIVFEA